MLTRLLLLLSIIVCCSSWATNYHVRPESYTSGSNNGSDWTNAFQGMPAKTATFWLATVQPGDTIYVAGGTYTVGFSINQSGTAGNIITVRRATTSEHGSNTGWDNSLDTVAQIPAIATWGKDYITIDGITPGGFYVTGTSGYLISSSSASNTDGSDFLTLRYITAVGSGVYAGDCNHQVYHAAWGDTVTIQYCDFSNIQGAIVRADLANALIENNSFHDASSGLCHADLFITYNGSGTFRNNTFYNTGAAGIALAANDGASGGPWSIYNNLFYQVGDYVGSGNIIEFQRSNVNCEIYNNTIVGGSHGIDTSQRASQPQSSATIKNNIIWNTTTPYLSDGGSSLDTKDYNLYVGNTDANGLTSDPLLDSSYKLQPLSPAINTGTDLSATFNTDKAGNTRPCGNAWDIGAYERCAATGTIAAGSTVTLGGTATITLGQ